MNDYGMFTEPGTIRFERILPGPIERVWSYLTESEKRGQWLASGEMDLRKGGSVELIFNNSTLTSHHETPPEKYKEYDGESRMYGTITEIKPPKRLSYTWSESSGVSEVTFELESKGKQVKLTLTHRRLGDDHNILISVAGGWHTHLNILVDKLNGREPKGFWSEHMKAEKLYEKQLVK
ncbi:SRPBCC family protein [Fodinibius sp. Rm-B-1B1-1]|uniref:SRPBCC family protein n=1 Tax=Fodinibius alkaliphilus TaxID=3140241 RepID=UPI00315A0D1B